MSTQSAEARIPGFVIGDRLRKAREKTGLDQTPFAVEIGVSRGTVSSYERADTADGLKRPFLMAWALRCDVPLDWLLTGKANAEPDTGPGGGSGRTGGKYAIPDSNREPADLLETAGQRPLTLARVA